MLNLSLERMLRRTNRGTTNTKTRLHFTKTITKTRLYLTKTITKTRLHFTKTIGKRRNRRKRNS
jgi:hypothetical protein